MRTILLVLLVFGIGFAHKRGAPTEDYDRGNWGSGWLTFEGQDTRQRVLIAENLAPLSGTLYKNGKIFRGMWICKFTGDTIWLAKELDIDHMVPLKEAWWSGGDDWDRQDKVMYANYEGYNDHLVAVKASANSSKGAKDPYLWMPEMNKCWYLEQWVRIKLMWGLEMDSEESDYIFDYQDENCKCK